MTPEEAEELDDAVGEMLETFGEWTADPLSELRSFAYHESLVEYYSTLDRLTEGK